MILLISFEGNEHVEKVRKHLQSESVVVDQAWFPAAMKMDARLSDDFESIRLALPDGRQVLLGEIGAVWNRRIRPYELDQSLTDPTSRMFAWSESNEALQGIWHSLNCFWMNPPAADDVAQRKIRQLQVARQVGLSIPVTTVTNDPQVARDFITLYGPGNVIRKAFRNIQEAPRETHVVAEEDLALIDSVQYAPVTFQEFVPAAMDLRVTVIEDEVFAASIEAASPTLADYRPQLESATMVPYDLPEEIQSKLLKLMRRLSLAYGAIDLRVTPTGEHVFLEVNPAGEYLFVSERTRQPIPEAIAACLDRHNTTRGSTGNRDVAHSFA